MLFAIHLLGSLMKTRRRDSFMQSAPILPSSARIVIAIEQQKVLKQKYTETIKYITYEYIVGNLLAKQTNAGLFPNKKV